MNHAGNRGPRSSTILVISKGQLLSSESALEALNAYCTNPSCPLCVVWKPWLTVMLCNTHRWNNVCLTIHCGDHYRSGHVVRTPASHLHAVIAIPINTSCQYKNGISYDICTWVPQTNVTCIYPWMIFIYSVSEMSSYSRCQNSLVFYRDTQPGPLTPMGTFY